MIGQRPTGAPEEDGPERRGQLQGEAGREMQRFQHLKKSRQRNEGCAVLRELRAGEQRGHRDGSTRGGEAPVGQRDRGEEEHAEPPEGEAEEG